MRRTKKQKVEKANLAAEKISSEAGPEFKMDDKEKDNLLVTEVDETLSDNTFLAKTDGRNMVLSQSVVADSLNIPSEEVSKESAGQVTGMEQINRPFDTFPEHSGKVIDILSLSNAKELGDAARSTHPKGILEVQDSATKQGIVGPISVSSSGNMQNDVVKQVGGIDDLEEARHDAMQKLRQFINEKGGQLGDGWEVEILKKRGRVETNFVSPGKQKLKSQAAVAKYLGLLDKSGETKVRFSDYHQSGFGISENNHVSRGKKDAEFSMTGGSDSHKGTAEFNEGCNGKGIQVGKQREDSGKHMFQEMLLSPTVRCHGKETRVLKVGETDTNSSDMVLARASLDAGQNVEGFQPSSTLVNQQCQDVLRRIISAETFGSLCSMFQILPSATWEKGLTNKGPALVLGGPDFQLISLRMAAGVYEETPAMFLADLQQVWKNIHSIGSELILLADSLSKLSCRLYNKQVLTLFPEAEMGEKSDGGVLLEEYHSGEQISLLCAHLQGRQHVDVSGHSSKEDAGLKESGEEEVPSIRGDEKSDMEKQSKGQILLESHAHEAVETGLQPTLAVKSICKSEGYSQGKVQRKKTNILKSKRTLKNVSGESVCKGCGLRDGGDSIVCSICNVGYHMHCLIPPLLNRPDNVWCCPHCAPASTDGLHQGIKPSCQIADIISYDAQELSVALEQKDAEHASGKLIQGSSKKILKDGLCKTCGKDDQQVLLCDSCGSGYHIQCLTPGLDRAPEGNWCCPTCTADGKKLEDLVSLQDVGYTVDDEHAHKSSHGCAVFEQIGEKAVDPVGSTPEEHPAAVSGDRICKLCGAGGGKLIICCDACAMHYHLSCLKPPLRRVPTKIWYCPSCLCRVCKVDINDDKILLCDACDEGYHTYCLSPPLQSIPEGCWYCPSCAVNEILDVETLPPKESVLVNSKRSTKELERRELSKRKRKSVEPKRVT